ncbi:MAG: transposase [Oligosphaeraceae bacterium]
MTAGQPPSSSIARAAAYSLDREAELRRHLADPRLNIDNNPCENVIRPLCLGRRNWLFVGSEGGGVSMAVLAGLVATCRENGVDFEEWLLDVLPRLDTHPPPASASYSRMSGGPAGTPRPSRPTDAARAFAYHPHGRPSHPYPCAVRTTGRLCPRFAGHANPPPHDRGQ